jgi:hypothetical protein
MTKIADTTAQIGSDEDIGGIEISVTDSDMSAFPGKIVQIVMQQSYASTDVEEHMRQLKPVQGVSGEEKRKRTKGSQFQTY